MSTGYSFIQLTVTGFKHSIVAIEGLDVHFIHERSTTPGVTPILWLHGWPGSPLYVILPTLSLEWLCTLGSFDEFDIVIKPLTRLAQTSIVTSRLMSSYLRSLTLGFRLHRQIGQSRILQEYSTHSWLMRWGIRKTLLIVLIG
jgi:hypothetical protein